MPPLKIIVANGQIPLVDTFNDRLAETLAGALRREGHRVSRLRLPMPPSFETLPRHLTSARLFDLSSCDGEPADRLIALDLIAGCLDHPRKILWIADLFSELGGTAEDRSSEVVRRSAGLFLTEAERPLAISSFSAAQIRSLADVEAKALWPPLAADLPNIRGSFATAERRQILLLPVETGRLPIERICRLIERIGDRADVVSYCRLGQPPETGLLAEAEAQNLSFRWLGEVENEAEVLDRMSCVWLAGVEEQSPWPAWTALAAAGAVVCGSDAGVSAELVDASGAGTVVSSDPHQIAEALLEARPSRDEARSFLDETYPTWSRIAEDLLRGDHRCEW